MQEKITTRIAPGKVMSLLSPSEVNQVLQLGHGDLYSLFRRCTLAVLNSGSLEDNAKSILEAHADYDIEVIQQSRGIKLSLKNAPSTSFVDGAIIQSIREQLFSVLRDVIYHYLFIHPVNAKGLTASESLTDSVFKILRHARVLKQGQDDPIVVCWGGHSISRTEYEYTKLVGYELGLRGLHIGTGCGPGAMKGPMKGATIGHAKQHIRNGRYIGLTEPDIIAAEAPNSIVNELVILPDIEKRLEAFVRLCHGIIVFPGGAGTAEEILYLLGLLLTKENQGIPFPLIFTAPESSRQYFEKIDAFIKSVLGEQAADRYQIIINDPPAVAKAMQEAIEQVFEYRRQHQDAYYFNWLLNIPMDFQQPFEPSHENMAKLNINQDIPTDQLAANLRRVFSGIVAGNVKDGGIRRIEEKGPYLVKGDKAILQKMDDLLLSFIQQGRMKLGKGEYKPCYKIISE